MSTALLIFARRPRDEARAKRLARSSQANRRVAALLLEQTERAARQSGLPVVVVSGPQQRGQTFGERLSNAFSDVFAQGFDRVIALGSDWLGIQPGRLREAAARLDEVDTVLGPTPRGGVYLLGLTRAAFEQGAVEALPWQTPRLFEALVRAYGPSTAVLAADTDVNASYDLGMLRHRASRLQRTLLALLSSSTTTDRPLHRLAAGYRLSVALRGPPQA